MGYRDQGGMSQRDSRPIENNDIGNQIAAAAASTLGGLAVSFFDANRQRKAQNQEIIKTAEMQKMTMQNNLNKSFGPQFDDKGNIVKQAASENTDVLKQTMSKVLDDQTEALIAYNSSGGSYNRQKVDPVTGEIRTVTREDDLNQIKAGNDLINNVGQTVDLYNANLGKMEDILATKGVGTGRGQINPELTDPKVMAIAMSTNPSNGIDIKEEFSVVGNATDGYRVVAKYAGKDISKLNEGKEFEVDMGKVSSFLSDPTKSPNSMFGYIVNDDWDERMQQSSNKVGLTGKNGLMNPEFSKNIGTTTKVLPDGSSVQVTNKSINFNEVQNLVVNDAKALTQLVSKSGPDRVLSNIQAYASYDSKTGEYFISKPKIGEDGFLQYDKNGSVIFGERIVLATEKDGATEINSEFFDLSAGGDQYGGMTKAGYDNLTSMYTISQLTDAGVFNQQTGVPIPGTRVEKPETKKPTEGDLKRIEYADIAKNFITNLNKAHKNDAFGLLNREKYDASGISNMGSILNNAITGGTGDFVYDAKIKQFVFTKPDIYKDGEMVSPGDRTVLNYDATLTGEALSNEQKRLYNSIIAKLGGITEIDSDAVTYTPTSNIEEINKPKIVKEDVIKNMGALKNPDNSKLYKDDSDVVKLLKEGYPDIFKVEGGFVVDNFNFGQGITIENSNGDEVLELEFPTASSTDEEIEKINKKLSDFLIEQKLKTDAPQESMSVRDKMAAAAAAEDEKK
jgi:hypothetical protein